MYKRANRNSGQSTLEYAFVIAVIVGALIAMQIYIKRSMEGKMKSTSDEIGEGYSARNSKYENITETTSNSNEKIAPGNYTTDTFPTGGVVSSDISQTSTSQSRDHVLTFDKE